MPQQTDRHGPRLDEQLARENQALTHGAPDDGRTEARREQAAGPGEPTLAVARDEIDRVLDLRALVAEVLAPATYPATRAQLLKVAKEAFADEVIVAALAELPARTRFPAFGAVWDALGYERPDERREPPAAKLAVEAPPAAADAAGKTGRFAFRFEPLLAPFGFAVGVTPWTTHVDVDEDRLEIRFGPWLLETERANVFGAEVSGPYSFLKVVGPPHLSFADRGVTFATNRQRGVCITFHEPVHALPRLEHPGATVTVADPEGLVEVLRRR